MIGSAINVLKNFDRLPQSILTVLSVLSNEVLNVQKM